MKSDWFNKLKYHPEYHMQAKQKDLPSQSQEESERRALKDVHSLTLHKTWNFTAEKLLTS